MLSYSTLAVTDGSSIEGNTATGIDGNTVTVRSSALALASGLTVGSPNNQLTFDRSERETRDDRARMRRCAHPRVCSQSGGGAYVHHFSTVTVTDGSSIGGNTANVSSPAFALSSGLVVGSPSESIDARS